jgi:hypothetical protein
LASLQARSSLRSAHPLIVVNKLISLTAFIFLLAAGWVAVNYLKNEVLTRWHSEAAAPTTNSAAVPTSEAAEARSVRLPVRLVYACAGDKEFYHSSTHLSARCDRVAMSEEAALTRGLKRCHICLPE